jgi:hypothetical protein
MGLHYCFVIPLAVLSFNVGSSHVCGGHRIGVVGIHVSSLIKLETSQLRTGNKAHST